ncbi:signal peptidase I [Prevotella communis]|jgi:signal peptidase I|uniref:Signal peptidase I n=1 Tax=Prevotella communis TaxID=2913614 RepID=A0A1H0I633_9BACT|nr:signal peptidase I [Prevotella communis]UKK56742.1 signal peptidase I [Prevotella communis]UKK59505.1 signal peptidase I [Prevotella communis]UKK62262.1 signal peptidase I [Prevotella communis]UKK65089.1 signal peptidase I [Prevotella communis]SDH34583.1 signal peptidase I [Prevotella communis]
MKKTLRFLLAFLIAFAIMMVVRMIGVTLYTISGTGSEPVFQAGDRVMVNRWSYGLRVGGKDCFFGYGRIARQSVEKGDLVAFENPQNNDQILIYRCKGLPGDTIVHEGNTFVVPSLRDCADADYYWLETLDSHQLGFIAEEYLIGRAFMVVYSRDPLEPLWKGWRSNRILLPL